MSGPSNHIGVTLPSNAPEPARANLVPLVTVCACPVTADRTPDGLTATYPLHNQACADGRTKVEGTS